MARPDGPPSGPPVGQPGQPGQPGQSGQSGGRGYGEIPTPPPAFGGSGGPGYAGAGYGGQGYRGQGYGRGYGGPSAGAYGAPPAPGMPPGPGVPGRRKSKLGLWIALAVVLLLIVGTGVTLAVVHPWAGDHTSDDGGEEDAPSAVSGDLDGDGLGDVQVMIRTGYESYQEITGTSDGKTFDVKTLAADPATAENRLMLDWNDDGKPDTLSWEFDSEARRLSLTSTDPDFPDFAPASFAFSSFYEYGYQVLVTTGDFNGDGEDDIAVAGPHDRVVDVYVLTGKGDGTFDQAAKWGSIANTIVSSTSLDAGDFDGDGDDDIFSVVPNERLTKHDYTHDDFYGDYGTVELISSGTGFSSSQVAATEDLRPYGDHFIIGNITGGDHDSVVTTDVESWDGNVTFTTNDVVEGRLTQAGPTLVDTSLGERSEFSATTSDVDGDGDDDIVYLARNYDQKQFLGFQVVLSDGDSLQAATTWGSVPPCTDDTYCDVESMY